MILSRHSKYNPVGNITPFCNDTHTMSNACTFSCFEAISGLKVKLRKSVLVAMGGGAALGRVGQYFQLQHLLSALDLFGTSIGGFF
jgi:hypothetical protein